MKMYKHEVVKIEKIERNELSNYCQNANRNVTDAEFRYTDNGKCYMVINFLRACDNKKCHDISRVDPVTKKWVL